MAEVYFTDLRVKRQSIFEKFRRLLKKAGMNRCFKEKDLVAIKIHFGEKGNTAYIRPQFARVVVDMVKKGGGKPFLTDTNTLYVGTRSDAVSHIRTAIENGFAFSVVDAPIVIADGLRGDSSFPVEIGLEYVKTAKIAHDIHFSDAMIVLTHFKAHELSGFGGAIKNLGMGCASREGKLFQHSNVSPKVNREKCVGCGSCKKWCSQEAIEVKDGKAEIDEKKCVGCGECIITCPKGAIEIQWNEEVPVFQKKMAEYAYAAVKNKRDKVFFVNFIMDVSPACDCYSFSDYPIVPDIGILASTDPVAIDQASYDLVKNSEGFRNSALKKAFSPGEDKFRDIYPEVDPEIQLEHAEKIGLGERSYKLIKV